MSVFRRLADLEARVDQQFEAIQRQGRMITRLELQQRKEQKTMADFTDDETRLETDVQAETALVQQVQTTVSANATQIATLNAEITTLQQQGVDTTKMEEALTQMETNNTNLSAAVATKAA